LNDSEHNDKSHGEDQHVVTKGTHQVLDALFDTPAGSHNILVYSDLQVLRQIYPVYIRSLLENNEIVLILTYYDHPSVMKKILGDGDQRKFTHDDIERYVQDGSLVVVDSLMSYFDKDHKYTTDVGNNNLNILSLIRILLNHGVKNSKNGITIISDMGAFFHSAHYNEPKNDGDNIHRILEYERSIPTRYKDLELTKFCLYHQKDFESHFKSTRKKAQLLDSHVRSLLVIDNNRRANGF